MELQKWKIFQYLDPIFKADVRRVYPVGINSFANRDFVSVSDSEREGEHKDRSQYTGGVMVMRNDDVYFITRKPKSLPLCGQEKSLVPPFVPIKIDGINGQQIRAVSSGGSHAVILTTGGRVFQFIDDYQSAVDTNVCPPPSGHVDVDEKKTIKFPEQFLVGDGIENKQVTQIACGEDYTLALTSEGDVYAWGCNVYGQLGTGTGSVPYETNPFKISGLNGFESKVVALACTGSNSFALDEEGSMWSWGGRQCLGYVPDEQQMIPRKIPLGNIRKIATGNTHALALSNAGELYFWGEHSQWAYERQIVVAPELVDVRNVVAIGAIRGSNVSACKTANGSVYFWGFAYGHRFEKPSLTRFRTIAEVFASLDSPKMLEPLTFELEQPITDRLKLSFDDKETGDVRFKVEEKVIYAHSWILKLRSDHFRRMFDHNWKENDEKEVEITEFTYQGFRAFLLYLYTDRIDPPPGIAEDALELLQLADYYGEKDLKGRCEHQLQLFTTVRNVIKIYASSLRYHAQALHDMALDFMITNMNDIVETEEYRNMSDELKTRLIQELAQEHALKRKLTK